MEWLERHQLRRLRWIGKSNRYFRRERLISSDAEGGTVREKDIGLYVAASSVLHVVDGWAYAGRALEAMGREDSPTAIHLGYYASLRAAMAVLASEGLGIFNDRHISILAPPWTTTPPSIINRTTHTIAWFAIEHWAKYVRSGDMIGTAITPHRTPLRDWLGSQPGSKWRPVAHEWLLAWGADLRQLARDRDLRNSASYRPQSDHPNEGLPFQEFAGELWKLADPAGAAVFQRLDVELLRASLEAEFEARRLRSARGNTEFSDWVRQILGDMGHDTNRSLYDTLVRAGGLEDSPILRLAGQPTRLGSPTSHMEVVARAFLLLRIATGAVATVLREAGVDRERIEFWWLELLQSRGVWGSGPVPSLDDLWDDVADAVEDAKRVGGAVPPISTSLWLRANADAHTRLVGLERVAVAGLLF